MGKRLLVLIFGLALLGVSWVLLSKINSVQSAVGVARTDGGGDRAQDEMETTETAIPGRSEPTPSETRVSVTEASAEAEASPTSAGTHPASATRDLMDETPPGGAPNQFGTDFSKHIVPYSEIFSGGPPKDGIPAIDFPHFVSVDEAEKWLEDQEPVVVFSVGADTRAYPLQILIWHEIVNDEVGGKPVVVTFCPLCNTAIAFERTFDGQVLDFGTTGRLRFSNLIMYDRQTETWWQQGSGEAIAGEYTGEQLTFLPATIISWEDFKKAYPDGMVLSRETGFARDYGRNPYIGYDNINSSPFLYNGPDNSDRLPPMARVLTVEMGDETVAYPYEVLMKEGVINDEVAGAPVVIVWEAGTASALDSGVLVNGRDVGSANSFSRNLDGQVLTFYLVDGQIVDDQTGSVWNIMGQAMEGELDGSQLEPIVGVNQFWFSWAAFKPETRVYQPLS
jgi:Protein of unknown function (DUF3179)